MFHDENSSQVELCNVNRRKKSRGVGSEVIITIIIIYFFATSIKQLAKVAGRH